jgi:hypothetical protein
LIRGIGKKLFQMSFFSYIDGFGVPVSPKALNELLVVDSVGVDFEDSPDENLDEKSISA